MTPVVVLVGAPGAGKTTTGEALAGRLGVEFTDTDAALEASLGQPLSEAWAGLGESGVKAAEVEVCRAALERQGVVALGSGALDDACLRDSLAGLAVCWLRVSTTTATRRLGLTRLGMETLAAIREEWDRQLATRERWYEGVATSQVTTDRLSPEEVVTAVIGGIGGGA
ncbi:MAG TPA: shikimate kinase [Propionicimonas sp.]|nr:shikimate kinase [Propionicimonas sp.]